MTTIARHINSWIHATTRHSAGNVAHAHQSWGVSSVLTRHFHRISKSSSKSGRHQFSPLSIPYPIYCDRNFSNLVATTAQKETIYALSTPAGKGGVAIVRISGPDALEVWKSMLHSHGTNKPLREPTPWKLQRCRILHPEDGSLIDDGLAVYFRAPYSYTTFPTVELHIHSGRALISALLSALSSFPQLRPAEPGEFTRQALLGGRLDLTQVEGLHDLIEADTEVQRVWALGGAGGETRSEYDALRNKIIHCLSQIEALIDFGEGEDIEAGVYAQAQIEASELLVTIQKHLSDSRRGELIRSGIKMAIFGPPNAGKSSLFNYLANRQAAIVTPIPGTTRDVLELTLDIGGLPVVVADTAGIRATQDTVEVIGVQRGISAVKAADVSVCVLPLPEALAAFDNGKPIIPEDIQNHVTSSTYFLFNKTDLVSDRDNQDVRAVYRSNGLAGRAWSASLTDGKGTHAFVQGLSTALKSQFEIDDLKHHAPLITRARHRVHLESACRFLEAFLALPPEDVVLAAEELRYAAQAVGRVTGVIGVEDVLDALFRDFCIGK
uniref:tRNA modification GTPase TrmE n=1 Tax=Psilocybe cubensis TaxID=181762 RepID=A0A8H8CKC8_PSICU